MRVRPLALTTTFLLAVNSCGDPTTADPVGSIELPTGSLVLGPGDVGALTAVVRSSSGAVLEGRPVTWTSSDTLIASVNAAGMVTGHRFGEATVTAAVDGRSASASVTVTATRSEHLAGEWRMLSFDGLTVPATYAYFPDEPTDSGIVDVDIRLDSARLTLRDDGVYPFRQYCFTELHDEVARFRYCWGDHGRFFLGNPAGRIAFVSEYIQNLSASGTVVSDGLSLTEPLWISETPRATVWVRRTGM